MKPRRALWLSFLLFFTTSTAMAQGDTKSTLGRISLPHKTWGLVVDLTGFTIKQNEFRPDGRKYLFAENPETQVIFSVFLEEQNPFGKSQDCRANLEERKKSRDFTKTDFKMSDSPPWLLLEYMVPEFKGAAIKQKNLFACMMKEDVFIDLHFSKVSFQPGEERLFKAILDAIQFQEGIERTSMNYLQAGSVFYLQRNYRRAIGPYRQALELEKKNPALDKNLWRALVDNLGMAFGITGDLQNAKATFEYGLSQDPTYPLFHYNLACTYAEMGDLQNAMPALTKAFEYRDNMIPGETMPDPRQDDSFKPHLKNKPFREFLDELVKRPPKRSTKEEEARGIQLPVPGTDRVLHVETPDFLNPNKNAYRPVWPSSLVGPVTLLQLQARTPRSGFPPRKCRKSTLGYYCLL